MTGAASTGHSTQNSSNIMMLLSLKLILLVFFILLNSLADFEVDRARAVIASVNQAFSGKADAAGRSPAFRSSIGALPEVEAKMREVGSLFEVIAPSSKAKSIRRANMVQIEMPVTVLFRPVSPRLRQGREALLTRLARALRVGSKGAPRYLLEVLVGTGMQAPANDAAPIGSSSLALRRAAVLAARLSAEGVPFDGLSAGLRPGAAGSLQLVLRLHPGTVTAAEIETGEG